jgi:hypothetical protein
VVARPEGFREPLSLDLQSHRSCTVTHADDSALLVELFAESSGLGRPAFEANLLATTTPPP